MAASFVAFLLFSFTGAFAATFDPYFPHDLAGGIKQQSESHFTVTGEDLAFLIRSQEASPHVQWAEQVKADIQQQYRILNLGKPRVALLHHKYEFSGSWTIMPLLPKLQEDFSKSKWLFFCEEQTRVSVHGLLQILSTYNPEEKWFLGHALQDRSPTVIHHYRFHDNPSQFSFPDFEAGWLMSSGLLKSVAERWRKEEHAMDFSIDIKHELAFYIWNNGKGLRLTHLSSLCAGNVEKNLEPRSDEMIRRWLVRAGRDPVDGRDGCISAHPRGLPSCGKPVPKENILFAVKTCSKFHKDRVPIVQKTWGKVTDDIVFISDVQDDTIPTIASGVPNTERGHCGKLFSIFRMFNSKPEYSKYSWLVVADDDTILSVTRLQKLLSCYDSNKVVFVGERYGYGHLKLGWGYDYLTGGSGMVFSRAGLQQLLATGCKCNKDEDPDDMILGMCTKRHDLPITHSPVFHQARPMDYAKEFLDHQTPVSIHKHLDIDPMAVYQDWFQEADEMGSRTHRQEL